MNNTDTRGDVPLPEVEQAVRQTDPISSDEFSTTYAEPLEHALDLTTWKSGADLSALYERLDSEILDAVGKEHDLEEHIRATVFPRIRNRPGAPRDAGVYQATLEQVQLVHEQQLFAGLVEACDGTSVAHDTLPITIVQLGVCLVSYHGDQGAWSQRLFRRDLRASGRDPVEEALDALERRQQRAGFDASSRGDQLTDLARRGLMAYAERGVLLERSSAPWRMGHGNPAPYELVTGSGSARLAELSLDLLRKLILDHKRFVFVPSGPAERHLLTIGNALRPLEYAIVDTLEEPLTRIARGGYRGEEWGQLGDKVDDFASEIGPQVIRGVYKASALAPAH
ncbi:MAG: hypothetical protein AB7V46_24630, partial [Thermomicrobiales bacterium]